VGGNYAPTLGPGNDMKKLGYTIMLFLDSKSQKYVEEFATSNFAALSKPDAQGKRTYITPKSRSVLPSVTNRSLLELAALKFGWAVERRPVEWQEVKDGKFDEIAACGTAVVITPVGQIDRQIPVYGERNTSRKALEDIWDDSDELPTSLEIESVTLNSDLSGFKQLYDAYRQIQTGESDDQFGWMYPKEGISF
jgi:branched-chain amino acid aminotransferase